jgi:uncharacterized protein (DUF697 family)
MAIKEKYRSIVKTATVAAGAMGIPGAFSFGLDVTAMSSIWITMIVSISRKSNHEVDGVFAAKLAAGVLAGAGAYVVGSRVITNILPFLLPVAGSFAAMGVNSALNAWYTYKLGQAISNLFDKGDFDSSDAMAAVKTISTLIIGLPTYGEMADVMALLREDEL